MTLFFAPGSRLGSARGPWSGDLAPLLARWCAALVLTLSACDHQSASNAPGAETIPARSIAVLPFADLSEQHDQAYFSDGLSVEIIDRLARSENLLVVSRTSSFSFRDTPSEVGAIGEKLRVANVLEGSVRRQGSAVRVSAQLVRARDGVQLWAQTYDRDLADIFRIQDDIAETVAHALSATLRSMARSPDTTPRNPEAYNRLLQGNYLVERENRAQNARAIDAYRNALALEPGYALAWVRLASAYAQQASRGFVPFKEGYAHARDAIETALRLAPNLAEAHAVRGSILFDFDWDWAGARADLERAIALDPANLRARSVLAYLTAARTARPDAVIAVAQQQLALDPLYAHAMFDLGYLYQFAGRLDEALATWQGLVRLNPGFEGAYAGLATTLVLRGRVEEAADVVQKEVGECERFWALAIIASARRDDRGAEEALGRLQAGCVATHSYDIAEAFAFRGEKDAAFAWLQHAIQHRDTGVVTLSYDSYLSGIRDDPRFDGLLVQIRLK